ncbi:MAG: GNAT family N-acetyltransferase [Pusillimonas sp.]|nr:GNAT family N-acetyltransferase [Pusillimonas sp.]
MNTTNYTVRSMTRPEIDVCIEWAAAEGWNPGLHDADAFYAADPEGFLLGSLNGEPIACISAVRYGETFGFIGFYIVAPAYREQGYGLKLWHVAMQRLHGRLIGLDGVVAQQNNYRKSGFEFAYNNIRYQGVANPLASFDAGIVDLASVSELELNDFDSAMFPAPRRAFLSSWISRPGTVAKAVIKDDVLQGYGVIRPCRAGYKIGPLFARNAQVAQSLYDALVSQVEKGAQVQLDIPQMNAQALALVKRNNMLPVFETARMYTGPAPQLPIQNIFGVTSFELG